MAFRPNLEKKEEKERVRAALLRAALRLGASHGFSSVGLREVAREAGIAPTSFYRHFADMEELGMALIRELVGRTLRSIGERAVAAGRAQLVPTLVDAMLAAVELDAELMRFVVAERVGAFSGLRALLRAELATLADILQTVSNGAAPEPAVVQPVAADAAVALLIDGCARALDAAPAPAARQALREGLWWSLGHILEPSRRETETSSP